MSGGRFEPDPWLSEKLGKPAFHCSSLPSDKESVAALRQRLSGKLFADARVEVSNSAGAGTAREVGFSLIDVGLKFRAAHEAITGPEEADLQVTFAEASMADAVGLIAEQNFRFDRFHRDPQISHAAADAIKLDWARNYFSGLRGDWMVVALDAREPVGFLQLLRGKQDDLIIDLIAVSAAHQRKGIARAMISFATAHCSSGPVMVGTQASNVASIRLYESIGFRFELAHYVFHHHGISA